MSNNDTMLKELVSSLPEFCGAATQSRCFTHVINLVAKSILSQFNGQKSNDSDNTTYPVEDDEHKVPGLDFEDKEESDLEDLESDEDIGGGACGGEDEGGEEEIDDGDIKVADWLDVDIQPVSCMIAKVSCPNVSAEC